MADYVFRYKLDRTSGQPSTDPLLEMMRSQLKSILNVVVLTEGGREVKVDGFKLLGDRSSIHEVFPQREESPDSF